MLANRNPEVHYQVVIENNSEVDLVDVGLSDDLSKQFGPDVFKGVSDLTLVTSPTNNGSFIALDSSRWDGTSKTNLFGLSDTGNRLAAGDSFVVGFKVEVDPSAPPAILENAAVAKGIAVDNKRAPLIDASGKQIVASGTSDRRVMKGETGAVETRTLLKPKIRLLKTPSDAVANGDKWDVEFTLAWKNTGTVAFDKVEIYDDLAAMFGGQFAGATIDGVIAGANNKGTAPVINASFASDTSRSLVKSCGRLEVGDSFEVAYTVTVDPNAVGTAASGLDSQATTYALAVDAEGVPIIHPNGALAITQQLSNSSNGAGEEVTSRFSETDAQNLAGTVVANVAVAKTIAQKPLPTSNGNFEVVCALVVSNTGAEDLTNISLVENLSGDFGSAFLGVGDVTIVSPPSDVRSILTLDRSWNGNGVVEIVDQTLSSLLAAGDSFKIHYAIELDAEKLGVPRKLKNQTVSGTEVLDPTVDDHVDSIVEQPVLAEVVEEDKVDETIAFPIAVVEPDISDDPVPSADLTITKAIAGQPIATDRGNLVVTYQFFVRNSGNVDLAELSLMEDLLAHFDSHFVKAGNVSLSAEPSDAVSSISVDAVRWNGKTSTELLDSSASNLLTSGDSFTLQFDVEIRPRGTGSSKRRKRSEKAASAERAKAIKLIEGLVSSPGPIYSGSPTCESSNSKSWEGARPGAGGISVGEGSIIAAA